MSLRHSTIRSSIALCFLCISMTGLAAVSTPNKLTKSNIPVGLKIDGVFVAGLAWTDSTGENGVVLSKLSTHGPDGSNAELHAVGYRKVGSGVHQTWRVQDWEFDCNLDLTSVFATDSLEVTDVDRNGIGEVSFVYRKACNGGMDLIDEKLFMIENGKKFPIRGGTQLEGIDENGEGGHYDGPMIVDNAFNDAPAVFKVFAIGKWRKFRSTFK